MPHEYYKGMKSSGNSNFTAEIQLAYTPAETRCGRQRVDNGKLQQCCQMLV